MNSILYQKAEAHFLFNYTILFENNYCNRLSNLVYRIKIPVNLQVPVQDTRTSASWRLFCLTE